MQRLFDDDNAFGRASAGVGDSGLFGTPQKQNGYGAAFNGNGGITMSPLAPKKDQSGLPPPMVNPGGYNGSGINPSAGGAEILGGPYGPPRPNYENGTFDDAGFHPNPMPLPEGTKTGGLDFVGYHGGLGGPQPMGDQGYTPNPMPVPPRDWRQPQEGGGNFNPMPVGPRDWRNSGPVGDQDRTPTPMPIPPRGWRQPMLGNRGPVQMAPRRQDPRNGMFNPPQRMFGPQQGQNAALSQLPPQVLQYLLSLRGR